MYLGHPGDIPDSIKEIYNNYNTRIAQLERQRDIVLRELNVRSLFKEFNIYAEY